MSHVVTYALCHASRRVSPKLRPFAFDHHDHSIKFQDIEISYESSSYLRLLHLFCFHNVSHSKFFFVTALLNLVFTFKLVFKFVLLFYSPWSVSHNTFSVFGFPLAPVSLWTLRPMSCHFLSKLCSLSAFVLLTIESWICHPFCLALTTVEC